MSEIFDCSCLNGTRGHIHEHYISPLSQKTEKHTTAVIQPTLAFSC